ncbi:MAG TPA: LytR C-terminal domain-containing protein [Patescibacteria group bacterium]|nr:LytR C-terminal domain-containing protein [Patescibacteria group bacterium]
MYLKYKIEVLNGSGISGEASKVKGLLEEERFTVSSIGNADGLNYQQTVIQAKKTVPKEFLDKLKGFLDKLYVLDDTKELPDTEKFDFVVTIGSKKVK